MLKVKLHRHLREDRIEQLIDELLGENSPKNHLKSGIVKLNNSINRIGKMQMVDKILSK
jgi:hypothetical protein